MGRYFTLSDERAEEIAAWEPDLTPDAVQYYCCDQDWREGNEHQQWLDTAPAQEIADWVVTIQRGDKEG